MTEKPSTTDNVTIDTDDHEAFREQVEATARTIRLGCPWAWRIRDEIEDRDWLVLSPEEAAHWEEYSYARVTIVRWGW